MGYNTFTKILKGWQDPLSVQITRSLDLNQPEPPRASHNFGEKREGKSRRIWKVFLHQIIVLQPL